MAEEKELRYQDIKCIALDLDMTTLRSDGTLSQPTKEALAQAIRAGIAVLPVSGRPYGSLPEELLKIPGIAYAVTSNGASVYRLPAGEKLHDWMLCGRDVRAILHGVGHFFLEGQITYEAFIDGIAYGPADYVAHPTRYGAPERAVEYIQRTRRPVDYIIDFIFQNAERLDCLDIILKDGFLRGMVERRIRAAAEDIYITSSVDYRLEISHRDSGKASGLAYMLKLLGIRPQETIAFGDGDNDAGMLAFAGIGAAVANASEACLASADIVVAGNDEDGPARLIREKILR